MKKTILTSAAILFIAGIVFSQQGRKEEKPVQTVSAGAVTNGTLLLLSPANAKEFTEAEISKPVLFRWAPVSPKPKEPVTYRLQVWQLMQGQNAGDVLRSAPAATKDVANITQTAVSDLYTGPCRPPYLCDFIWTVEALNSNDLNSGKSFGASTAFTFKVNTEGNEKNADKRIDKANPTLKSAEAQGDPIHGVDVKLGFESKNQCAVVRSADIKIAVILRNEKGDPIHGVDIKPMVSATTAQGDPIHGVDIKPGVKFANAQGDPVHGVDIKVGVKSASAQGDPIHGVDVKLGLEGKKNLLDSIKNVDVIVSMIPKNLGDPIHGVDIKLGAVAKNAQGDPVHGVDIKIGVKSVTAQGDPIHGVDIKLGIAAKRIDKELDKNQPQSFSADKELDKNQPQSMNVEQTNHMVSLPVEKIIYDAAGNVIEIVLKPNSSAPVPKVVVAGSKSFSGGYKQEPDAKANTPLCWVTVYCHNPLHPPGCGWMELKPCGGWNLDRPR